MADPVLGEIRKTTGSTTLSSGSATVDTGVSVGGRYVTPLIKDAGGADVAYSLEDDTGTTGNTGANANHWFAVNQVNGAIY